jgi:hypothetical protein
VVLRYTLCVKVGDGEAVVGIACFFFGDVATDLIGKPPDVLINEFLASTPFRYLEAGWKELCCGCGGISLLYSPRNH